MGTIMLIVILARALKGHFRPDHHFGFGRPWLGTGTLWTWFGCSCLFSYTCCNRKPWT